MNFKQVEKSENDFKNTGNALGRQYYLEHFAIAIPNESDLLEGYTCRPADGFKGYFIPDRHIKSKVVLHFTVGHLMGDILSLTSKERGRVSTAFVLGRDGTVYQLFSSAYWSWHLGPGAKGGNTEQSKMSIGIELSNYGPLRKKGNKLHTVYSKHYSEDVYCDLNDVEQYVELNEAFRGYKYYTAFTDEQYKSVILLLRYLTVIYNIPRKFLHQSVRFNTSEHNAYTKGILSHINFRSDKFDIGPAFDWNRVIEGVTAEGIIQ